MVIPPEQILKLENCMLEYTPNAADRAASLFENTFTPSISVEGGAISTNFLQEKLIHTMPVIRIILKGFLIFLFELKKCIFKSLKS